MEFIINPEYENLVPKLSKDQFDLILRSIKENGQQEPIIINDRGVILDGHHRFKICRSLGIECSSTTKIFVNDLEEKLYVIDSNLARRQLNEVQRVQLARLKEPFLKELSKLNMSQGGKGESIDAPLNRVNDIIAKDAGSSSTQVQRIKYVLDNASEPIKQKLLNGRMKVNRAYKDLRNQHWLAEQIANNKKLDLAFDQATDKITLLEGDFEARCSELEADSVSLIFTDPLYDENHIYLYDGLGKVAMRLLRPGGSLITYINQIKLFVIGQKLLANGLTFWCPLYLKMAGNSSRYFDRHIEVDIKLLLWFVKGNRPINPSFPKTKNDGKRNYMGDLIISEVPDKRFHNYGQNPKDVEHIMKYLTATNDLILDPFLGGGSTAVACMNMQRRFIGIDVDPMAIERTTANLRMNTTLVS